MKQFRIMALSALIVMGMPCAAQMSSMPGKDPPPAAIGNDRDPAVNKITQYGSYDALQARVKQLNKEGKTKTAAELLAEDKADATALVSAAKLPCAVTDALLVAEDTDKHTKTYEVACGSGTGYFLVQAEPPGAPSGFTCFAAEAARNADIAAHREPAIGCGLPENGGTAAMAATILSRAGKVCAVRATKWLGQSRTTNTDFLEVACSEGAGFVVRSPVPGSQLPLRIDTCVDSARYGLPCSLTETDPVVIASTEALKKHGVACDAESTRVLGHEAVKKRRVVEFYCPRQQPKGLVAFIPLEESKAPFETFDCVQAATHGAVCTLTKPN